jgi:site-specific recombinase XerD
VKPSILEILGTVMEDGKCIISKAGNATFPAETAIYIDLNRTSDLILDRKKLMKRLCEKAGVRYFRFHPIRHSGASIMDGNGIPLGAIQRILGHENRRTTEIYLHSMGDSEREAMRVFEQARQISPHFSHTDT